MGDGTRRWFCENAIGFGVSKEAAQVYLRNLTGIGKFRDWDCSSDRDMFRDLQIINSM